MLFVTSADRPFTESERQFLESVREWGKKIVDRDQQGRSLRHRAQLEEVRQLRRRAGAAAARDRAGDLPGLSARLAQRAKAGEPAVWAPSGFESLETYIRERLDEHERVRLKLANPLGVGADAGAAATWRS